jgi:pyruvate,orthophosphate dikinase
MRRRFGGGDVPRMTAPNTRWVYADDEGSRDLLGGEGANVAEMTRVLGADVMPAGFTITTAACVRYLHGGGKPPEWLADAVHDAVARLEPARDDGSAIP